MGIPIWENAPRYDEAYDFSEKSIGTVYLTGAGYVRRPFKGIAYDSKYGWNQMVWARDPKRDSYEFSISNMDDINIGRIARCVFSIKYLNRLDYEALRDIVSGERYFKAEFFDMDKSLWIRREMYCSKNESTRFFTLNQSYIGAFDYSIEFVGTNNDNGGEYFDEKTQKWTPKPTQFNVTYNLTGPVFIEKDPNIYPYGEFSLTETHTGNGTFTNKLNKRIGSQIQIEGAKEPQTTSYEFYQWVVLDENGKVVGCYEPNQMTTVWGDLNLHASWKKLN